ncbi:MAG: shikimate dehydrogenase, partial [Fimbriimonadaceae bacterium]
MRFGVIGDPVSHSLSPRMHRAAYCALGLDHSYDAFTVLPANLGTLAQRFDEFKGLNVTVPHKEAVCAYFALDEFAIRAGAVNTIDLLTSRAINTDGPGFLDLIEGMGIEKVLLLGAGGSTRSIALALCLSDYQVSIWNRTQGRAEQLVNDLEIPAQVSSKLDLTGFDLVVNATSSSLQGESLPNDWSRAEPNAVFCDLYYTAGETPFAKDARRAGGQVIDGRELLVAQGARSFEWWLETEAPRDAMRQAVYK